MLRHHRVKPSAATATKGVGRGWLSAEDEELLASHVAKMRQPPNYAMGWRGGSATLRAVLCVPAEQIQERLFQFLSVYNLVHALILSGSIGIACTPLDPRTFAAEKEPVVLAYNVCSPPAAGRPAADLAAPTARHRRSSRASSPVPRSACARRRGRSQPSLP